MRGKDKRAVGMALPSRITPAYAGKSATGIVRRWHRWDHPRVCGEKQLVAVSPNTILGSPPRMRGKVQCKDGQDFVAGITPAYAGKRPVGLCVRRSGWDHPRVCGEKPKTPVLNCPKVGSPPRMRGKVYGIDLYSMRLGITPAYAGKRLKRSHSIGHFSCILCLFHSVLHRASVSDGSRAGPCAPPCLPAQNAVPV